MKNNFAALGAFIILGITLFTVAIFLVGNRHQAFNRHEDLYVEMATVTGIAQGSKVRAGGLDAGQVEAIELPSRPSGKFRVKLQVEEKLHAIIREDSLVTVESDGLVGDKFLMIHSGSDESPMAPKGFTLPNKEPVELSAIIEKVSGTVDQANATIGDLRVKIDGTLDSINATVLTTNGLVTDVRHGKGTVGTLLSDEKTAAQVKQVVTNVQQATGNIQQASVNVNDLSRQAQQLMNDVQSRNLPAKIDDTVASARNATEQIDETSQKINSTLAEALGPDSFGTTAADNLRDTLSSVNLATANLADDTEALKHGFLFRGFFKKRGFYTLKDLTAADYRSNAFFQRPANQRIWIGPEAFGQDDKGRLCLTIQGKEELNQMIGGIRETIVNKPIVIEGYSSDSQPDQQLRLSRDHALLVAQYLEAHFYLHSTNIGAIPLGAMPPTASGKSTWDGAAIVLLERLK